MQKSSAILLLIVTGILWSLTGVLVKSIRWSPISIAGSLCLFSALTQLCITRRMPRVTSLVVISGSLFYAVNTILFIGAIYWSSIANAVLLQFSAPVYVALVGGRFLEEPPRLRDWTSFIFILFGMVLFFRDELTPVQMWGTLMAVLSGVTVAGYTICLRKQKHDEPIDSIMSGSALVIIGSSPWMIRESWDIESVAILACLGLLCYGLAFTAYTAAIKHVRAVEALLISTLEIILGPFWGYLIFDEQPGAGAITGGGVILVVVTLYGLLAIREPSS